MKTLQPNIKWQALSIPMLVFGLLFLMVLPVAAHDASGSEGLWLRYRGSASSTSCFATHDNGLNEFVSADASAVQNAISAATDNDVVKVAGTCSGVSVRGGTSQTAYITQTLTLQGGYDASSGVVDWDATPDSVSYPTILNANSGGRVVYIADNDTVKLFDLTLTGGQIDGDGAGVYITNGTVTISNTIITTNSTDLTDGSNGGGLYLNGGVLLLIDSEVNNNFSYDEGGGMRLASGTATLNNVSIYSNTSDLVGGGIDVVLATVDIYNSSLISNITTYSGGGLSNFEGNVTISNTQVLSNTAQDNGDGDGGGIYNYNGPLVIQGATIAHNKANDDGGGIENLASLTISDSQVYNNSAADEGGGLRTDYELAQIDNTDIYSNTAEHGGGIYAYDEVNLYNSSVTSNTVTGDGGGITTYFTTVTLSNTQVISNTALDDGGGLDSTGGTIKIVNGTIFKNNHALDEGGGLRNVTGTLSIDSSQFISNTAGTTGGAVMGNDALITINDSILRGGEALAGGGLFSLAEDRDVTVTISNSTLNDNHATVDGGAIVAVGCFCYTQELTMSNSILHSNSADELGGAIYADLATVNLSDSTLYENSATIRGGAISSLDSFVTVSNSTIRDNSAAESGGIASESLSLTPSLLIEYSTLSSNSATTSDGGAIWGYSDLFPQSITLVNSTLSGNQAANTGGAIWDTSSTITLTHTTIAENSATSGQALAVYTNTMVTMQNSIIATEATVTRNSILAATDTCLNQNGILQSNGFNLGSDTSCDLTATGDISNTVSLLDDLADNGGSTETRALQSSSPAIDTANNATCEATDQRGVARPIDGDGDMTATCDIGAFELEASPLGVTLASLTANPQNATILLSWETVSEQDNLGFHLLRGTSDDLTQAERLTSDVIPSQAPGSGQGMAYEWTDGEVEAGSSYFYWLEAVDVSGETSLHGPISATAHSTTAVTISQLHTQRASSGLGELSALMAMLLAGWNIRRRRA